MSNVIYVNFPTLKPGKTPIAPRTLARALLLKLDPPKEGDIAAILEPRNSIGDVECVLHWLDSNQHRLTMPYDCDQCFELLCNELNDLLVPF